MKAVIFDLDGTLLDTLDDLYLAVDYALRKNGLEPVSRESVRQFVGNGLKRLAVLCAKEQGDAEAVFQDMKEYYGVHFRDYTKPYAGICDVLEELKKRGYMLSVVSNKPDLQVRELTELYFHSLISVSCGQRDGIAAKPAPDTVFEVLKIQNVRKDEAVYVGDSEVDIQTARNAGIKCVSVTWGFRDVQQLRQSGAECLIDEPAELLELV